MSVLTIRMADEKHERLRKMADAEGVSINSLFDEWATMALAQHEAEIRFEARAATGDRTEGLAILDSTRV